MHMFHFNKKKIIICILSLLCAGGAAVHAHFTLNRSYTEIIFFNVGNGDGTLIITPHHKSILIDGGPDLRCIQSIGRKMSLYDRDIDLMILTHPHTDHYIGLIEVLDRYNVKNILENTDGDGSSSYSVYEDALKEEGARIIAPYAGNVYEIDGVRLTVLHPKSPPPRRPEDLNDLSIVVLVEYGDSKILLTGDLPITEESNIDNSLIPDVDILKVAHHGSKGSTSDEFLSLTKPEYAVISVGIGNSYGHPHAEAVERLLKRGVKILRTDEKGTIVFRIYSDRYELHF